MFLQMLGDMVDFLGEDTNLNLRRTCVLRMSLEFTDDLLLIGFLESHGSGGKKGGRAQVKQFSGPPGKHEANEEAGSGGDPTRETSRCQCWRCTKPKRHKLVDDRPPCAIIRT